MSFSGELFKFDGPKKKVAYEKITSYRIYYMEDGSSFQSVLFDNCSGYDNLYVNGFIAAENSYNEQESRFYNPEKVVYYVEKVHSAEICYREEFI